MGERDCPNAIQRIEHYSIATRREAAGEQLASVHSTAENAYIMSEFLANTPNGNAGGQTLIGGQRTGSAAGNWKWSDGSGWDFTAWSPPNPDNAGSGQHYHALASPSGASPSSWFVQGQWDDASCDKFCLQEILECSLIF
ncbi:unnamed protein product, partial [Mesorhabditis belari]|uniref:C-type lectin domain-containing protein n=1 Tax=Mesorhabditis belari TaxID=2138241 RepID=A0AAF3EQB0_9BILA